MPYKSITAAEEAGFNTKMDGAPLTLGQINMIAEMYDAIKAEGKVDNPMAVAVSNFKKSHKIEDGEWVKKEEMSNAKLSYETEDVLNQEILAAGDWKSIKFDGKVFDELIKNAEELKERVGIPLKLGHEDKQVLLEAMGLPKIDNKEDLEKVEMPAAGWVTNLRKMGQKLVADFVKVPKVIADIIKNGGYNSVSSEVWKNYIDPGLKKTFGHVLSAVALLGESHKAITSLKNIQALYTVPESVEAVCYSIMPAGGKDGKQRIFLSELEPEENQNQKKEEGNEMELKEAMEKVEKLTAENTDLKGKVTKLEQDVEVKKTEIASKDADVTAKDGELKAANDKVTALSKEVTDSKAEVVKLAKEKREAEISVFVDAKLKDGKMLPKDKEAVKAILMSSEMDSVIKLSIDGKEKEIKQADLIKSLFENQVVNFSIVSETGKEDEGKEKTAEEKYTAEVAKIQKENPTMALKDAMAQASKNVPEYKAFEK